MYGYYVGVDLGQAQDYTAITVLQRKEIVEPQNCSLSEYDPGLQMSAFIVDTYELRHLERPAIGTSYLEIVKRITRVMHAPELTDNAILLVDATGCGRPVVDMLKGEGLQPLIAITITGGNSASQSAEGFNVPKTELVSVLQLYLQSGRLKIAAALPDANTLKDEILNFRVKVSLKDGEETFGAWREGIHDDMVLATAIPLWYASRYSAKRPLNDLGAPSKAEETPYDVLRWGL